MGKLGILIHLIALSCFLSNGDIDLNNDLPVSGVDTYGKDFPDKNGGVGEPFSGDDDGSGTYRCSIIHNFNPDSGETCNYRTCGEKCGDFCSDETTCCCAPDDNGTCRSTVVVTVYFQETCDDNDKCKYEHCKNFCLADGTCCCAPVVITT